MSLTVTVAHGALHLTRVRPRLDVLCTPEDAALTCFGTEIRAVASVRGILNGPTRFVLEAGHAAPVLHCGMRSVQAQRVSSRLEHEAFQTVGQALLQAVASLTAVERTVLEDEGRRAAARARPQQAKDRVQQAGQHLVRARVLDEEAQRLTAEAADLRRQARTAFAEALTLHAPCARSHWPEVAGRYGLDVHTPDTQGD